MKSAVKRAAGFPGALSLIAFPACTTRADLGRDLDAWLSKDLSVFKKQPDGSWKLLMDMWSSDEAPAKP